MAEEIITSTNVETATDHEYNASEIQVLKGLEAVRKRPGMYIGSTGERGLHHLVYEIVDNAIDEALAGYCNHIEVKILKDNIIQVTDNGRGIPVDIQADTGLPAVTVVYTILHAGGKFGGENSGYKVAGGLHGVGASVVNACSEWLRVNVRRDGHEYEQTFRRGDPDGPLKCLGTVAEGVTGTRVTFKPDPEMFKDTTVYNFETLEKRLREESFLNAGVKITLTDERELYTPVLEDGQEGDPCYRTEVMCYEGGIKSFVTYLGEKRNLEVLHPNVIYLARPCQFNTKVPACTKEVWTTARFSQAVIDAEVDALKELAGNRETVLIGFSGGAQVAGLMSVLDKDLKVRKLVTVAGNLDHEAWCRQHKMPMLDGSLSLADFREEYISIPQAHFVGENDAVVNPFLTREFIKDPGRIREVKGASHAKGWNAAFPAIWEEN